MNETSLPILIISMLNEREQNQKVICYLLQLFSFLALFLFRNQEDPLSFGSAKSICDLWLKNVAITDYRTKQAHQYDISSFSQEYILYTS